MTLSAPETFHRPPPQSAARKLRILATTDVHMNLTAHNFVTDTASQTHGFAGVATLIEQARAEAQAEQAACVLFDNGDLLQGSAMGDFLAARPVTDQHPVIACMNVLRYDAMGVGNHDLDYGMPYLRKVAAALDLPVVASNLSGADISPLMPSALIRCLLPAHEDHPEEPLTVGVLSVLPQQTSLWNQHLLDGVATVDPATDTLRAAVPALRAQGADLVVVLAHMGLDKNNANDDTAQPLATIPGIDAMITGHTHRRFPARDHATAEGVNLQNSTIAEVPAVMPGHGGSDLAVLDLRIARRIDGGWQVQGHRCALRQNTAQTHPAPSVLAATARTERTLRSHLSEVVGHTPQDLQNFFALVQPTPICALTAKAKSRIARTELRGMAEGVLPLIIATSAHTAGGRDGPHNFLNIPKGPVLRRHLSGLDPYGNQIWALRITGLEVKQRLEHAASVFAHLSPETTAQTLHNPTMPMFNFDTYFGLHYEIDPLRPEGQRITGLSHGDTPVTPTQDFVLITSQFRAAGGGGYPPVAPDRVILRSPRRLEDGLRSVLRDPTEGEWSTTPWRIRPSAPACARMETSPDALQHLHQIAQLSPRVGPTTPEGFVELSLSF